MHTHFGRLIIATLLLLLFVGANGATLEAHHRRAFVDGDVIIGVLLPIHEPPTSKTFTTECGQVWENYGVHRLEALLLTLDDINSRADILPNVTLGVDVRDECWFTPIALEQTIDFIRTNLYYNDRAKHNNASGNTPVCNGVTNAAPAPAPAPVDGYTTGEQGQSVTEKPVALVIGPGSSTISLQVQNLLSLFNIPQIGYSATSNELTEYKYYARVVPPDKHQAEALAMLCANNDWNYVSLVNTKGTYGGSGIQLFKEFADKLNVCTAMEGELAENADYFEFDATIRKLNSSRARVVVCFCDGKTLQNLINATTRLNLSSHFLFVGSDGWADRLDVLGHVIDSKSGKRELSDAALGVLSIRVHSKHVTHFDEYFLSLRPSTTNRTRNRWFNEFWQVKFNCHLPGETGRSFERECTGNESLRDKDYKQDTKLGFVVSAVYTAAYALHNLYLNVCRDAQGVCQGFIPVDGTRLMNYLVNVTYTVDNDTTVWLNTDADPPAWYDIMNYQISNSSSYEYVVVGEYQSQRVATDRLALVNATEIYWPNGGFGNHMIESRCSPECPFGQIRQLNQDTSKRCCWVCVPCNDHAKVIDNYTCADCPLGEYPDELKSECVKIPIEHVRWSDAGALFACCLGTIGALITLLSLVVFVIHHNTSVVKASTRELSYIILLGILFAYCCTYILIAQPTTSTCTLNRLLPGVAFTMIYASLATKTNRIARILAGTKRIITKKPRFVSASSQLVITSILIVCECLIELVFLIADKPEALVVYPTRKQALLLCTTLDGMDQKQVSLILPLAPNIVLIVMCTFYAIKTRNLPENFNEAKFIGFTMYTTCVIWLGFVIVYFGSDFKVITMATSISLSATVALVLLFFPKLYIILWHPERNVRSAFTTTTDVRCHIGVGSNSRTANSSSGAEARRSSKFEEAAISLYRQKTMLDKWRRGAKNFVSISTTNTSANNTVAESTKVVVEFDPMQAEKAAQKLTKLAESLNSVNVSRSSTPSQQPSVPSGVPPSNSNSVDSGSVLANGKLRLSSHEPLVASHSAQTDDDLLLLALEDLRKRRLAELMRDDPCFSSDSSMPATSHSSPTKPNALSALASKYVNRKMERSNTGEFSVSREAAKQQQTKLRTNRIGTNSDLFNLRSSLKLRKRTTSDKPALSVALQHAGIQPGTTSIGKLLATGRNNHSKVPPRSCSAQFVQADSAGWSCPSDTNGTNMAFNTHHSDESSTRGTVATLSSPETISTSKSSTPASKNPAILSTSDASTSGLGSARGRSYVMRLNEAQIVEESEGSDEDSKLLSTSHKSDNPSLLASGSSSPKETDKFLNQGSTHNTFEYGLPALRVPIYDLDDATSSSDCETLGNDRRLRDHSSATSTSVTPTFAQSFSLGNNAFNQSLENMSVLGLKLLDKEEERFEKLKTYLKSRGMDVDLDEIQTSDV